MKKFYLDQAGSIQRLTPCEHLVISVTLPSKRTAGLWGGYENEKITCYFLIRISQK